MAAMTSGWPRPPTPIATGNPCSARRGSTARQGRRLSKGSVGGHFGCTWQILAGRVSTVSWPLHLHRIRLVDSDDHPFVLSESARDQSYDLGRSGSACSYISLLGELEELPVGEVGIQILGRPPPRNLVPVTGGEEEIDQTAGQVHAVHHLFAVGRARSSATSFT